MLPPLVAAVVVCFGLVFFSKTVVSFWEKRGWGGGGELIPKCGGCSDGNCRILKVLLSRLVTALKFLLQPLGPLQANLRRGGCSVGGWDYLVPAATNN